MASNQEISTFNYEKLKDILVCPVSRDELVHEDSSLVSINPDTRYSYPIVDGIPRLLEDEAQQLTTDEWAEVMKRHERDGVSGEKI